MRRLPAPLLSLACLTVLLSPLSSAQSTTTDYVQVAPPAGRIPPPSPADSAEALEKRGDELRAQKAYLDALDYFKAALSKNPTSSASIYNKMGISELQIYHLKEARKYFERAAKADRSFPDAYNNLGVVYYELKNYGKAISLYSKAIHLRPDAASYYSNLGAAYFSRKDFPRAMGAYTQALQLDPEIFDRTSRTGVAAQLSSPEDRARYDYTMARLYARMGLVERSLQCLRRAMEEGYKDIGMVYKDEDFSTLRKDPRFAQLMAAKPLAIPE